MICHSPACNNEVPDSFYDRCVADPILSFKSTTVEGRPAIYDRGAVYCSNACWRAEQPAVDYTRVRISIPKRTHRFAGLPELHDEQNIPSWMTDDGAPDSHEVSFGG
jgi:hypothetical protein